MADIDKGKKRSGLVDLDFQLGLEEEPASRAAAVERDAVEPRPHGRVAHLEAEVGLVDVLDMLVEPALQELARLACIAVPTMATAGSVD